MLDASGAIGFRVDSSDKITHYFPNASPKILGVSLVEQLKTANIREWRKLARKLVAVNEKNDPEESEQVIEQLRNNFCCNETGVFLNDWDKVFSECAGNLQSMLEAGYYLDRASFLQDSLYCDWAYVLNFDDAIFEVYAGFQREEHTKGRFARVKPLRCEMDDYWPVALVGKYRFTAVSAQELIGLQEKIDSELEDLADTTPSTPEDAGG